MKPLQPLYLDSWASLHGNIKASSGIPMSQSISAQSIAKFSIKNLKNFVNIFLDANFTTILFWERKNKKKYFFISFF